MRNGKTTSLGLLSGLLALTTFAAAADTNNYSYFPYLPRLTLQGTAGDYTVFQGDTMVPIIGNQDGFLYADAQAKSALGTSWLGSVGLGVRQIYQANQILGAYVFVDRDVSEDNQHFYFISPGVESLGRIWDFRANAYVPVGDRRKLVKTDWADNFGDYSHVYFTGHDQYDHYMSLYHTVDWGTDAEVGRTIPGVKNLAAYLGGYFFQGNNAGNIEGAAGRLEYQLNAKFSGYVSDTYDNAYHNTFLVGVKINFGGTQSIDRSDIHNRLLDQVDRNIATQGKGVGVPVRSELVDHPQYALERNNIWFFTSGVGTPAPQSTASSSGTITEADCTAENPCTNFNQTMVNNINAFTNNANFYLAKNTYNLDGALTLNAGQSIYGRSSDFIRPGTGSDSPLLIGAINLPGNNTIDSLQLMNDPGNRQDYAIAILNANNVLLNNLTIGALNDQQGYTAGAYISNSSVTITNSVINAYADDNTNTGSTNKQAAAIFTANGVTLNLTNNTLNAVATTSSGLNAALAYGIDMNASINATSIINATDNTFNTTATGVASHNYASATGIDGEALTGADLTLNLTHNTFNDLTSSHSNDSNGSYTSAITLSGADNLTATLSQNTFNVTDRENNSEPSFVNIVALSATNGTYTLTDNALNGTAITNGNGANITGFSAGSSNSTTEVVNLSGNTFNVSAFDPAGSASATAAFVHTKNATINMTNNIMNVNATVVDGVGSAYGFAAGDEQDGNTIVLNGAHNMLNISANASGSNACSDAYGIFLDSSSSGRNVVTLSDNIINASASSTGSNTAGAADILATIAPGGTGTNQITSQGDTLTATAITGTGSAIANNFYLLADAGNQITIGAGTTTTTQATGSPTNACHKNINNVCQD